MAAIVRIWLTALALSLLGVPAARAVMVTYPANLATSKGNPVTDLLILESDGQTVRASVYPSALPGRGPVLVRHEAPVVPSRSLLIGLTEGRDVDGSDKTQLVIFLDPAFAAARVGVPFSSVFPGARHNDTITRLRAAAAGDAEQLAWFTDVFFDGPAAGAAFASDGSFTIAEFTTLKIIGQNATAGAWMITAFTFLPENHPDGQPGGPTGQIEETAKIDPGPFDIELSVNGAFPFAIDKTVLNDTGFAWKTFVLRLGTGIGDDFVPSTPGDGLAFLANQDNRDESGAFPTVEVAEDAIVFRGSLPPGASARFIVFVTSSTVTPHLLTVRQQAVADAVAGAPAARPWALGLLAAALGVAAVRRLRRG